MNEFLMRCQVLELQTLIRILSFLLFFQSMVLAIFAIFVIGHISSIESHELAGREMDRMRAQSNRGIGGRSRAKKINFEFRAEENTTPSNFEDLFDEPFDNANAISNFEDLFDEPFDSANSTSNFEDLFDEPFDNANSISNFEDLFDEPFDNANVTEGTIAPDSGNEIRNGMLENYNNFIESKIEFLIELRNYVVAVLTNNNRELLIEKRNKLIVNLTIYLISWVNNALFGSSTD